MNQRSRHEEKENGSFNIWGKTQNKGHTESTKLKRVLGTQTPLHTENEIYAGMGGGLHPGRRTRNKRIKKKRGEEVFALGGKGDKEILWTRRISACEKTARRKPEKKGRET